MSEDGLLQRIRLNGSIPAHVAVIMDGNGRWAQGRSLPRPLGHAAGMEAVREAVEGSLAAGVEVLTLFAFSQENWQRPADEIAALMSLLEEYIEREMTDLRERRVTVRFLGELDRLAPTARAAVDRIVSTTAGGDALALNICISYGRERRSPGRLACWPTTLRPGGSRPTRSTKTPCPAGSTPRRGRIPTS